MKRTGVLLVSVLLVFVYNVCLQLSPIFRALCLSSARWCPKSNILVVQRELSVLRLCNDHALASQQEADKSSDSLQDVGTPTKIDTSGEKQSKRQRHTSQTQEGSTDEGEDKLDPSDDELVRLKSNALAAWLVNITLVVWIVWLSKKAPTPEQDIEGAKRTQDIIELLGQQLRQESNALVSDTKLKGDLRQEALDMEDIAKRLEGVAARQESSQSSFASRIVGDLRQQMSELSQEITREKSMLEDQDKVLMTGMERTNKSLEEITERSEQAVVAEDSFFGPLTASASGILASVDISFAVESLSLGLLISLASRTLQNSKGTDQTGIDESRQQRLRAQRVLRLYGRWDDQEDWVLLQSVLLEGLPNKVVGYVQSSKSWLGSWSDRLLTTLISRSCRDMMRRRRWRRIAEQTQQEVGHQFEVGYLVETAADKADAKLGIWPDAKKEVRAVPSASLLKS